MYTKSGGQACRLCPLNVFCSPRECGKPEGLINVNWTACSNVGDPNQITVTTEGECDATCNAGYENRAADDEAIPRWASTLD